jgi:signal transduction histidine kinase
MTQPIDRSQIQQYEPVFVRLYWATAIGCFLLIHLPGVASKPLDVYYLIGVLAICALVWYGTICAIGFITAFLSMTGGVESPFGLLYLLPIVTAFLILDSIRAWVVWVCALVGYAVLFLMGGMDSPEAVTALLPHAMIQMFVLTLGTGFTAIFGRLLHQVIVRERTVRDRLAVSEARASTAAEKLVHANTELHRLSRIKDDFVAMVNHDLRTPLTAMKQAANLFLKGTLGPLSDEQRDYMSLMSRNINRLTELITNLLDLSKLQAGKLKLEIAACSVQTIVQETITVHKTLFGDRQVTINVPDGLPQVMADENRMIQILGNLVSNAVKFSPADASITITAQVEDAWMLLSVEDTGMGIAPDKKDRVFEKYDRLDVDPSKPGTGLGMAISRELLELQHGTIGLESRLGGGSTFTMKLPLASVPEVTHG